MTAHPKYPNLFSPLRLGPVEVPTRFYFAPHGSALSAGTKPLDDLVHYSAARVRDGGCGLVVVALALSERGRTRQPSPWPAQNVASFKALTDEVHEAGGKVFGELLYHWIGAGWWQGLGTPAPVFSPSVRQFGLNGRSHSTRAMALGEIARMIGAIRQTSVNMAAAGFDGIMLHASHATLPEQFLSPYFNQREDRYGGSLDNRMRFLIEALQAAREGAGEGLAIGARLNCDEQIEGGYGMAEAEQVVARLCAQGLVDYLDLDVGLEPQQFQHGMPTGFEREQYYRPFVERVRKAATVPVLSVLGSVTDLAEAEAALAAGVVDMAGAARQLIAEPRFIQNARAGTEHLSRTCIRCNWCTAAGGDGAQGCSINPASYRERTWGPDSFSPASNDCRVIVVGGGPGGMEAARVAALRGHRVTLMEARQQLGGALALWASLPGRGHYGTAIGWWERELTRLGVEVRLGSAATAATVIAEAPDAVIVATGARYSPGGRSIVYDADIPGWDLPHVYRPEAVLEGGLQLSGKVLICDNEGYHAGTGLAEMLATSGATVQFVTANYAPVSARHTDSWEDRYIVPRMKRAGVRLRASAWLKAIAPTAARLYDVHTGEAWDEPADAVILATAREPVDSLARELEGNVAQLFTIGDALAARMLAAAPYEGQKFARMIGEPDAPATIGEAWFAPDPPETMLLPADIPRG